MSTLSIDVFIISIKVCLIYICPHADYGENVNDHELIVNLGNGSASGLVWVNSNYHKRPAINTNINIPRHRLNESMDLSL